MDEDVKKFGGEMRPTEKVRAGSDRGSAVVERERERQLWCDSAHLRQPDRRNHPHCQSGGVSSG